MVLDEPGPGNGVFHLRFFVSLQVSGSFVSSVIPIPFGPRKRVQSDANRPFAVTSTVIVNTKSFFISVSPYHIRLCFMVAVSVCQVCCPGADGAGVSALTATPSGETVYEWAISDWVESKTPLALARVNLTYSTAVCSGETLIRR